MWLLYFLHHLKCCLLHAIAVHFRFIVFRPFVGEVLVGTLTSSSSEGLHGNDMLSLLLLILWKMYIFTVVSFLVREVCFHRHWSTKYFISNGGIRSSAFHVHCINVLQCVIFKCYLCALLWNWYYIFISLCSSSFYCYWDWYYITSETV